MSVQPQLKQTTPAWSPERAYNVNSKQNPGTNEYFMNSEASNTHILNGILSAKEFLMPS